MSPAGRASRGRTAKLVALAISVALYVSASPRLASAAEAPLAGDSYSRVVGLGWGRADHGGSYAHDPGSGGFSVGGTVGSVVLAKPGANRAGILAGTSARDVDVRFKVRTSKRPQGGAAFAYAVTRQAGTNSIRPKITFNINGTVALHAGTVVAGK